MKKLYCFGPKQAGPLPPAPKETAKPAPGALAKFLAVPADMLLKPGEKKPLRLIGVDDHGNWLSDKFESKDAKWEGYIPPTARVKSSIKGAVADGVFVAQPEKVPSAGALKAELNGKIGITRGRVLPDLPLTQDFEKYELQKRDVEPGDLFAYPPLPWIGARLKWEIKDVEGNKALVKTVDDRFFQRAFTWMGTPDMANYTMQADVMSDGQTRKVGGKTKIVKMSEVGFLHHRYQIILKGTYQEIEVNSNLERLQFKAPFAWEPKVWYTLKTRVDVDEKTGVGTIRAKAWKKGDPEPEKWTLEYEHKTAHKQGAPGIYGFTPTDMPVYMDNISVQPATK
jgi:outer membrane protein assembly factor BamB